MIFICIFKKLEITFLFCNVYVTVQPIIEFAFVEKIKNLTIGWESWNYQSTMSTLWDINVVSSIT
jgi:hypothetical protein